MDYVSTVPLSYETSDDDTLKISLVQVSLEEREAFESAVFPAG